jgi:hypothetical protein
LNQTGKPVVGDKKEDENLRILKEERQKRFSSKRDKILLDYYISQINYVHMKQRKVNYFKEIFNP